LFGSCIIHILNAGYGKFYKKKSGAKWFTLKTIFVGFSSTIILKCMVQAATAATSVRPVQYQELPQPAQGLSVARVSLIRPRDLHHSQQGTNPRGKPLINSSKSKVSFPLRTTITSVLQITYLLTPWSRVLLEKLTSFRS
jgi:hypothetical protein